MNMDETTFELRELKSSDIFPMFKIMGKIGFKDFKDKLTPENTKQIMTVFSENKEGEETSKDDLLAFVGVNLVADILEVIVSNLPSCEQDIYTLLAGLAGMKPKDIANLPMVTFTEMIVAVVKKEEFKDFFRVVSKLFK